MSDTQADTAPVAATGDRNTHFVFEHKVFQLPRVYFANATDTGQPLFHIGLGMINGAMSIDSLRAEFEIKADSADSKLLGIIERSLKFAKKIRPGDSIPPELLDGTASWSVEDRHHEIANSRLSYQLATWMGGKEALVADAVQLEQLLDDPSVKKRIVEGFESVAVKLGLANKQEVVDRIDTLAREFAYIEALHERFAMVRAIQDKLVACARLYNKDRQTVDEIARMQTLIRIPVGQFEKIFKSINAETGEILTMLENLAGRIDYIRRTRDELHTALMKWDEIIPLWKGMQMVRSDSHYIAFKKTYQFLAQNYKSGSNWNEAR